MGLIQCRHCLHTFTERRPDIGSYNGSLVSIYDPEDFLCPNCGSFPYKADKITKCSICGESLQQIQPYVIPYVREKNMYPQTFVVTGERCPKIGHDSTINRTDLDWWIQNHKHNYQKLLNFTIEDRIFLTNRYIWYILNYNNYWKIKEQKRIKNKERFGL